ncbi:UNVERIFIED_CONTAM: hypothetical protein GTU68_002504, partial [Idotea baltica]|nr:hypothetical protein [Idotea baltica]
VSKLITILVDADSCPVKEEIYKVALRHKAPVVIVANSFLNVPQRSSVELVVVSSDFDAADDHIAERATAETIVITADILLADRCLKADSLVLAPNGTPFTKNSIGSAIATRALMEDLRAGGEQVGGPPPFSKTDRSRFLSSLHDMLLKLNRALAN